MQLDYNRMYHSKYGCTSWMNIHVCNNVLENCIMLIGKHQKIKLLLNIST